MGKLLLNYRCSLLTDMNVPIVVLDKDVGSNSKLKGEILRGKQIKKTTKQKKALRPCFFFASSLYMRPRNGENNKGSWEGIMS